MARLILFLQKILKGLKFAAPFLLGASSVFLAGGLTVYGIFSWVYSIVESWISDIDDIFASAASAISSFGESFVSSTLGQCIAFACAADQLLTVITTVFGIIFAILSFLSVAIIAGIVGIFVKLIVAKSVSFIASIMKNTSGG